MRILALDTATEACSVALRVGEQVLERYEELARGHADRLLPMVDELLSEAGVTLASLDAIAFGRGPCGFTGVRLAASIAQGLAFGASLGVVPVSDLAAVAQRGAALHSAVRQVLAVNDARMREVYWARFRVNGLVESAGEEHVSAGSAVVLPESSGGSWLAVGRGLRAAPELAERCRAAGAELQPELLPRAREVLTLAETAVSMGQILPPERALPVYVRDKVVASAM